MKMFKFLFPQRLSVTVHLSSGQTITFKCDTFKTTSSDNGREIREWTVEGLKDTYVNFIPSSIIAWEAKRVYF